MTVLPFGLDTWGAVWLGAAIFVAAFVRGYSGFGFAALTVSAAGVIGDPRPAVGLVVICDLIMTLQQGWGIRAGIDWRRVAALSAGALFGVPAGVAILSGISADLARGLIAVYVLAMCAALARGWRMERAAGAPAHGGIGLLSGLANGAGVGGLPVAAFMAAQPIAAPAFRATLIAYFTLMDLWTLPVMLRAGMIGRETAAAVALALPVMGLGLWLGGRHFLNAAPQDFRRFAIALLALLAVIGLARSVT